MTTKTETKQVAELSAVDQPSAIKTLAERMGVEASAVFMSSLKSVAFKSPNVTNEQLMALVVVSNQYRLNPFTRELYAFPDRGGGIVPIVSVDGWFRIINEHPQFDGLTYNEIVDDDGKVVAGEVTIYRKDRTHPLTIREYLSEVKRNTDPWKVNERRMLRHKTIIQGSRVAFGFAGIYDPDEGDRIIAAGGTRVLKLAETATGTQKVQALLTAKSDPSDEAEYESEVETSSADAGDNLPL